MPTQTHWRILNATERAALIPTLLKGPFQYIGGSLHVDEYHVVIDDKVYRFFVPATGASFAIEDNTEIEVSWEVEVAPEQVEDTARRARHMEICRAGDRFAEVISALPVEANVKAELVTQVVAMQRLAMVLNTPGHTLSSSKLNRF